MAKGTDEMSEYILRDYQQRAVDVAVNHIRHSDNSGLMVCRVE